MQKASASQAEASVHVRACPELLGTRGRATRTEPDDLWCSGGRCGWEDDVAVSAWDQCSEGTDRSTTDGSRLFRGGAKPAARYRTGPARSISSASAPSCIAASAAVRAGTGTGRASGSHALQRLETGEGQQGQPAVRAAHQHGRHVAGLVVGQPVGPASTRPAPRRRGPAAGRRPARPAPPARAPDPRRTPPAPRPARVGRTRVVGRARAGEQPWPAPVNHRPTVGRGVPHRRSRACRLI